MTGNHIRKMEGGWEYPKHEDLFQKCGLSQIEHYIEKRRGTLWSYLKMNRSELMEEAMGMGKHGRDVKKILWWDQKYTL